MHAVSVVVIVSVRKHYWILILFCILVAGWLFFLQSTNPKELNTSPAKIGGKAFSLEVANTPIAMAKGLGGRSSLANNQGMLFVLGQSGNSCFWMKDMNFDIDILWLNQSKQVIKLEKDLSPKTYPKSYCSNRSASFVIELKSGTAKSLDLQNGSKIKF